MGWTFIIYLANKKNSGMPKSENIRISDRGYLLGTKYSSNRKECRKTESFVQFLDRNFCPKAERLDVRTFGFRTATKLDHFIYKDGHKKNLYIYIYI